MPNTSNIAPRPTPNPGEIGCYVEVSLRNLRIANRPDLGIVAQANVSYPEIIARDQWYSWLRGQQHKLDIPPQGEIIRYHVSLSGEKQGEFITLSAWSDFVNTEAVRLNALSIEQSAPAARLR